MQFKQAVEFEVVKGDSITVRQDNEKVLAATMSLINKDGQVSQEELNEIFGEDVALDLKNTFTVEHIKDGKVVHSETISNNVTNVAMNSILDTYFGAEPKKAGFFLGLIGVTGFTSTSTADTMASHAGWTENVAYSEGTRLAWAPAPAVGQTLTGLAVAEFSMTAAGDLQGIFITDSDTKSGATGLLWASALFSSAQPVVSGSVFRVTYTLRLGNT